MKKYKPHIPSNIVIITSKIMSNEYNRLEKLKLKIIQENTALGGSVDGFLYKGEFHSILAPNLRYAGKKGNLKLSLISKMDSYLKDKNKIKWDKNLINQGLTLLLKPCKSFQDIRDALPETVVYLIPELNEYKRTREEEYTLKDNEKQYKQYLEIKDLIEFYCAMKLMY